MSVNEKMTAIADRIRNYTGGTKKLTLDEMPEEIGMVNISGYNNGFTEGRESAYLIGYEEGKAQGIEEGKIAERDAFWDIFQNNGNRVDYFYGFYSKGNCWNDITFNPKYNIIPEGSADNLFRYCRCTDIWGICKKNNVTIDLSNATSFSYAFANIHSAELGIIDISKATSTSYMFAYNSNRVKSIEKLISSEDTVYSKNFTFMNASGLENLIVEGVIGKNGFNVQWSTLLNKASIESIINALSTTTSGLTVTLSKNAVNNAFGINVDDASTYPEGSEYYELRQSKSNWTINYV